MRGGEDKLLADILSIVHADDEESKAEDATAMMRRRLVPEILLQLARKVSPFWTADSNIHKVGISQWVKYLCTRIGRVCLPCKNYD